jgi:hypothetical protein
MSAFDTWLIRHKYLEVDDTIFSEARPVSESAPEWIAMWILDEYVK